MINDPQADSILQDTRAEHDDWELDLAQMRSWRDEWLELPRGYLIRGAMQYLDAQILWAEILAAAPVQPDNMDACADVDDSAETLLEEIRAHLFTEAAR